MSCHSYSYLIYHLVWSTKDRQSFIHKDVKNRFYDYIAKSILLKNWHPIAIGGIENHIHILIQKYSDEYSICEMVKYIKTNTSKFFRENINSNFNWQKGYSVFTVDKKSMERVRIYILNQEEHHCNMNLELEYKLLLKRYEVRYKYTKDSASYRQ